MAIYKGHIWISGNTTKGQLCFKRCPFVVGNDSGLLAGDVVRYCERSATFGATTSQNLTAIFGSHSLAEAMFVDSATVGGLKSSFHFMIILIFFR